MTSFAVSKQTPCGIIRNRLGTIVPYLSLRSVSVGILWTQISRRETKLDLGAARVRCSAPGAAGPVSMQRASAAADRGRDRDSPWR